MKRPVISRADKIAGSNDLDKSKNIHSLIMMIAKMPSKMAQRLSENSGGGGEHGNFRIFITKTGRKFKQNKRTYWCNLISI